MNKSWSKFIDMDGKKIVYGFIDEGGKKWGDRYFVGVGDTFVPLSISEDLCKVCEALEQYIKDVGRPPK